MTAAPPWSAADGGVRVVVRVTPKGGRDGVDGIVAGADGRTVLAVRVAAPPADGAANEAVVRLIAAAAGLRPRDVSIAAGAGARVKQLRLEGDAAAIVARLEQVTGNGR